MDWAKKIEELSATNANEPVGDDWFTAEEFRVKANLGVSRSYRLLRESINANKMQIHRGSSYSTELRQLVRRVWYRFIDPK